jgi:hypothetical protein
MVYGCKVKDGFQCYHGDYNERGGGNVGLKRKLGSKNAKLLLECTKKKIQTNQ